MWATWNSPQSYCGTNVKGARKWNSEGEDNETQRCPRVHLDQRADGGGTFLT